MNKLKAISVFAILTTLSVVVCLLVNSISGNLTEAGLLFITLLGGILAID